MTCTCPKGWCYRRDDCRRRKPGPKPKTVTPPKPEPASETSGPRELSRAYLLERQAALEAEIRDHPNNRNLLHALVLIIEALRRLQ